mmetsp:Transcript_57926/g.146925  ORF Transcript_57926/g.146925 Transcript_57926/m.146925 type:complete len:281 (+) Transcript_57926:407-1249(+)
MQPRSCRRREWRWMRRKLRPLQRRRRRRGLSTRSSQRPRKWRRKRSPPPNLIAFAWTCLASGCTRSVTLRSSHLWASKRTYPCRIRAALGAMSMKVVLRLSFPPLSGSATSSPRLRRRSSSGAMSTAAPIVATKHRRIVCRRCSRRCTRRNRTSLQRSIAHGPATIAARRSAAMTSPASGTSQAARASLAIRVRLPHSAWRPHHGTPAPSSEAHEPSSTSRRVRVLRYKAPPCFASWWSIGRVPRERSPTTSRRKSSGSISAMRTPSCLAGRLPRPRGPP